MWKARRSGLYDLIIRLWAHLSRRRRRQFLMLTGLMVASAFAEVISLGAVLPFVSMLVAPEKLFGYPVVQSLAAALGIQAAKDLVLPVTIAFMAAAVVAGSLRMLLLRVSTRLVFASSADLSSDVYRRTLYQPYEVHLSRNTSEVISAITHEVNVAAGVLMALQTLATSGILLLAVMGTLIAVDPITALAATVGFGGTYLVITRLARRRLRANSEKIAVEHAHVIKALQEGLGGIRDVLLEGAQELYYVTYRKADLPVRHAQGDNVYLSQSPRYMMETLGMLIIAALAYVLSRQPGGAAAALPTLGVLAFGAQRLLPALQQMYMAWANMAGSEASLRNILGMLDQRIDERRIDREGVPLRLAESIRLESIRYRYSPNTPWVIDGLNLSIQCGTSVGLVGTTGSGKTTILDVIMGLLVPEEGSVYIDESKLDGSMIRRWQKTLAHVPQMVYLSDATVAENIAFGVNCEDIDIERVRRAARTAHIDDFIESRPEGYGAFVGERGIRLSGGQRQRLGIARALYKQTDVLILDEATSALDNATEQAVVESLKELDRNLTMILVAHRLTTVRRCDLVVQLENGAIVAQGTYDELIDVSPSFRRLATAV